MQDGDGSHVFGSKTTSTRGIGKDNKMDTKHKVQGSSSNTIGNIFSYMRIVSKQLNGLNDRVEALKKVRVNEV